MAEDVTLVIKAELEDAQRKLETFTKAAEKGLGSAAKAGAQATLAIDALEKELEQLRASGAGAAAIEKLETNLRKMRGELDKGTEAWKRQIVAKDEFAKKAQVAKTQMDDFGRSLGLPIGQLGILSTVMTVAAANLADLKKELSSAADIMGREFGAALGLSGGASKELSLSLNAMFNPLEKVKSAVALSQLEFAKLADSLIEVDTAAKLVGRSLENLGEEATHAQKVRALAQELRGTEGALKANAEVLLDTVAAMDKFGGVSKSVAVELAERLNAAIKAMRENLLPVSPALEAAADRFNKIASAADTAQKSLSLTPEAFAKISETGPPALEATAKAADDASAAAEKMQAAFDAAAQAAQDAFDAATAAQDDAQKGLDELAARQKELREKPVLTVDEANELNQLTNDQIKAQRELAQAHDVVTAAALDLTQANRQMVTGITGVGDAMVQLGYDAQNEFIPALDFSLTTLAKGSEFLDAGAEAFTVYADAGTRAGDAGSALAGSLQDISARLQTVATGSEKTSKGVEGIGEKSELTTEKADELAESLERIGDEGPEAMRKVGDALADQVSGRLGSALQIALQLEACLNRIGGGSGNVPKPDFGNVQTGGTTNA